MRTPCKWHFGVRSSEAAGQEIGKAGALLQ